MAPHARKIAVAARAGALIGGPAVCGSAPAQQEPDGIAPTPTVQALREAATGAGRFVGTAVNDGLPGDLRQNLERFADLGPEMVIAELDIRMVTPPDAPRLEQQARDFPSVAAACVAVAGCSGLALRGISDRGSWVPDVLPGEGAACVWDDNYQSQH